MEATLTLSSSARNSAPTSEFRNRIQKSEPRTTRDPADAIRLGLVGDLRRNWQAVHAYALYAERARSDENCGQEVELEARGQQQVIHGLILGQLLHRFGVCDRQQIEAAAAVAHAEKVAEPEWTFETAKRLRIRAAQCAAAGDAESALQLRRLAEAEEESPDLFLLA